MNAKVLPNNLAKGVDFCGVDKYYYIVRSDLTCYMRSSDFSRGEDLEVFSLHPSCRGGDHYLAHKGTLFYTIKGDQCRRVKNLTTDEDAVIFYLHPNCQGGDHYLSAFNYFYIIYQSRGVYRRTKNMNKDEDSEEFTLHSKYRYGLYYFGLASCFYFVKPNDVWGIQYIRTTNFHFEDKSQTFSFHGSVVNFLPGGLGVTKGPSYGKWSCIKTISNDSETTVEQKKSITKKIGYEMFSIEHNWKVSANVSAETGGLMTLIAKNQFSLPAEYGGFSVNTEKENWSEATEMEDTIIATVQPDKKIYVWSYQLGLGRVPVLYCREMRILDTSDPPTDVPLPPATAWIS